MRAVVPAVMRAGSSSVGRAVMRMFTARERDICARPVARERATRARLVADAPVVAGAVTVRVHIARAARNDLRRPSPLRGGARRRARSTQRNGPAQCQRRTTCKQTLQHGDHSSRARARRFSRPSQEIRTRVPHPCTSLKKTRAAPLARRAHDLEIVSSYLRRRRRWLSRMMSCATQTPSTKATR